MNKNKLQLISIIIPCRNEEKFIDKCLNSIIANDYPKEKLEILIIDGMSEDETREIVDRYSRKYPFVKLFDNFQRITPIAFNIGIKHACGRIIMMMGAHSTYKKDYISKCINYLNSREVDDVGGIWKIVPKNNSLVAKSIAYISTSFFGAGNAYFRIGSKKAMYVDTVWGGCYKKEIFERIGLFNENLVRNQDIEFNLRLKKAGGKILLAPDIVSYYHSRSALRGLAKNNFSNGLWVIYSTRFAKMPFSLRHLIPFFFVISLVGSLVLSLFYHPFIYLFAFIIGLYLIVNIFFSLKISLKNCIKCFPAIFSAFFTLHFSYGLGSLWGVVKLAVSKKQKNV